MTHELSFNKYGELVLSNNEAKRLAEELNGIIKYNDTKSNCVILINLGNVSFNEALHKVEEFKKFNGKIVSLPDDESRYVGINVSIDNSIVYVKTSNKDDDHCCYVKENCVFGTIEDLINCGLL